ncbi:hypothetical protein ACFOLC_02890 [Lysobacter cavernae]|uniref:DUF1232 domain-containing protein n=1 Tax=Lysobacter cavernae TaxID=1685901 RepID=A0ABV7RM99_9GAMM
MNATLSISNPLPAILEHPFSGAGRRRTISGFDLTVADVDRFNELLIGLGREEPPLARDQLASAARELCDRSIHAVAPPCIRQRMRRIAAARRMLGDPRWTPVNGAVDTAKRVVDYARGHDDLIPDWLPRVGRLDDAIVVETAWPQLALEIDDYLDFCRLREAQAQRYGRSVAGFGFNRDDWEQARYEEAVLAAQQRHVREASYLPVAAPQFRIH